ncbi:hypothetical protein ANN_00987 [Periplaneta americana]|uniref:Uncharacterized protein n=1 Tax=Periplaneta americana TaxID=6978 RepID=A0ABQ8TVJ8_PERAM|nr:hypothetical protein ANN_00987 [Periplaneta americana]
MFERFGKNGITAWTSAVLPIMGFTSSAYKQEAGYYVRRVMDAARSFMDPPCYPRIVTPDRKLSLFPARCAAVKRSASHR